MTVKPEDILQACGILDNPRVYLLPTSERPTRIVSQQRRALNLVQSLYQCGILGNRGLAIVGAGFGGLTAASYASLHGTRVRIFEKSDRPLSRFDRSDRYIHPRMYDWPNDGWDDDQARLPVMNWSAGLARDVVAHVLGELEITTKQFGVKVDCNSTVEQAGIHGTNKCVYLQPVGFSGTDSTDVFDAVIVAVGFGREQARPETLAALKGRRSFPGYWDLSNPSLKVDRDSELFVVGGGDGALADLIGFAALSDRRLSEEQRLAIFRGDFREELKKVEKLRPLLSTQERRIAELRAAGTSPDSTEYEKLVIDAINDLNHKTLIKGNLKTVTNIGRFKGIDLAGTYAANRFLYLAAFRDSERKYETRFSSIKWSKIESSLGENDREFNGSFQRIGKKAWLLERPGIADRLQNAFPKFAEATANPSLRTLALSERPISAAWSQCTTWISTNLFPSIRPLPRLSFSTEWADSVMQKQLKNVAQKSRALKKSKDFLTGLLRLHSLLFERILLTDANLIDGALLAAALNRLDAIDRRSFTAFFRDATSIYGSAVQFVTEPKTNGNLKLKDIQISTASNEDQAQIKGGAEIKSVRGIRRQWAQIVRSAPDALSEISKNITRLTKGDPNNSIISLSGMTTGLWSLIPQSGLLDALRGKTILADRMGRLVSPMESEESKKVEAKLANKAIERLQSRSLDLRRAIRNGVPDVIADGIEELSCSFEKAKIDQRKGPSSFDRPLLPKRSEIFENLQKLSGKADPFSSGGPNWTNAVASWYNAAYNTAIAKKNGANCSEVLWVNPTVFNGARTEMQRISIAEIGGLNKDDWSNYRARLQPSVMEWRLGRETLLNALRPLGRLLSRKSHSRDLMSTDISLENRLKMALFSEIEIGELANPNVDSFSSERAIVFAMDGSNAIPLSTIFVG